MKNKLARLPEFFKRNSISKRWFFHNLGVVILVMLLVEVILVYVVRTYYYSSAKQYLTSKLTSVTGVLSLFAEDDKHDFSTELKNIVDNFPDRNVMRLEVIDREGKVIKDSTGFAPPEEQDMPDYDTAMGAEEGIGCFMGKNALDERIIAVSSDITYMGTGISAVRLSASLSQVDSAVWGYTALLTLMSIVILLIITLTGVNFMNSIVKPIQQISKTTGKFAKGDFSIRIMKNSDDEIGELCTAINHMADELSNADAMKNEFISSVSHELRTPITAIRGWAETISAERDAVIVRKGIKVISNETERLSQMVEELLDFSRMQTGHFSMQFDTLDILAELGDAVLLYAERARIEDITMTYEEPEMLPFVYGDKNKLRQVFINIIDNAIKYSNKGGTVKIVAGEDPKGLIVVTVEDNGCGISDVDMPKIKTKFYKANHTKKGSGIGLAVADEIVALHGGSLTLESEAGKGTKVIITIPPESHKREKQVA